MPNCKTKFKVDNNLIPSEGKGIFSIKYGKQIEMMKFLHFQTWLFG